MLSHRVGWKENIKEQDCLACNTPLNCHSDQIIGGSHYYYFQCPECDQRFNFSTYDFTLRVASPRSEDGYDLFIDTIKHHFPQELVGIGTNE